MHDGREKMMSRYGLRESDKLINTLMQSGMILATFFGRVIVGLGNRNVKTSHPIILLSVTLTVSVCLYPLKGKV